MHLRQAVVSPQSRFANSVCRGYGEIVLRKIIINNHMCGNTTDRGECSELCTVFGVSKLRPDEHKGSTVVSGRLAHDNGRFHSAIRATVGTSLGRSTLEPRCKRYVIELVMNGISQLALCPISPMWCVSLLVSVCARFLRGHKILPCASRPLSRIHAQ